MEVWNLYPSGNSGNSYHKQSPKCIYILSITSTCVIPYRACFDKFPILCKDIIKKSYTFLFKKTKNKSKFGPHMFFCDTSFTLSCLPINHCALKPTLNFNAWNEFWYWKCANFNAWNEFQCLQSRISVLTI